MLVRGTHFAATLPPDWHEESDPSGGLHFKDATGFCEVFFNVMAFRAAGAKTIDWALLDLAEKAADAHRKNGATFVTEPRIAKKDDLRVTRMGVGPDSYGMPMFGFYGFVSHPAALDGSHVVVRYSYYEYWPPQRGLTGPPNLGSAEDTAAGYLSTLRLFPSGVESMPLN